MTLAALVQRHGVQLIAIGNGTASRETDKLAADVIKLVEKTAQTQSGKSLAALQKIVVSEAGASVYSASEFASQELPDVDVSLRGAVGDCPGACKTRWPSWSRSYPKSIGVAAHTSAMLNQSDLARQLGSVVGDCVNAVGVDLNTASAPLLARVSGLSATVANRWCAGAMPMGAFKAASNCLKSAAWGPKPLNKRQGFCAFAVGSILWT